MSYIVIRHFTDLQDSNFKYTEGDVYPREGYTPSPQRIEELSTTKNKQRVILIKKEQKAESAEIVEESAVEETAEEVPEVEEKPKRKSRKKATED